MSQKRLKCRGDDGFVAAGTAPPHGPSCSLFGSPLGLPPSLMKEFSAWRSPRTRSSKCSTVEVTTPRRSRPEPNCPTTSTPTATNACRQVRAVAPPPERRWLKDRERPLQGLRSIVNGHRGVALPAIAFVAPVPGDAACSTAARTYLEARCSCLVHCPHESCLAVSDRARVGEHGRELDARHGSRSGV